ncbi:MAG: hypothetical protein V1914_03545 [archaeon]
MNKLSWCLKIKNGIELREPDEHLAEAYLKKAEDSFETMKTITSKEWKITTAYYGMYFSAYAILMKIGVKCEIHNCTIEFIKNFLGHYFSKEEITFLSQALQARIDSQYYADREIAIGIIEEIEHEAKKFSLKCKLIAKKITKEEVSTIRKKLSTYV